LGATLCIKAKGGTHSTVKIVGKSKAATTSGFSKLSLTTADREKRDSNQLDK
jgi:hypothetical protein